MEGESTMCPVNCDWCRADMTPSENFAVTSRGETMHEDCAENAGEEGSNLYRIESSRIVEAGEMALRKFTKSEGETKKVDGQKLVQVAEKVAEGASVQDALTEVESEGRQEDRS